MSQGAFNVNKWAGLLFQDKFFLHKLHSPSSSCWKPARINRVDLKESIGNYHKRSVQLSPKDTSFLSPEAALETGAETHELAQQAYQLRLRAMVM